ncbi:hypothetical protein RvY_02988 [Ramazzottius varieornatus]|uniref:Ribosomal protein L7Ae/L30e/S12e/Gadd45 domain-containing protein n=1 Tax=Ramazzottius varieornatus TaxID=947166 RepID=A0A1D1UPZ6_RAMVA|nr:hypothetical protein RvY_02988 [Ramazzottius varieornatus]
MDATPSMTAPIVTSTQLSKNMSTKVFSDSAKKQKKKAAKMLLGSFEGLQPQWPPISKEAQQKTMFILSNFFAERNFKMLSTKEKTFMKREHVEDEDEPRAEKLRAQEKSAELLRPELVFGINGVTRSLEKDTLCLVIADRSVKPFSMISHLVGLAASRKCPAVAVENLATKVGNEIGVTSLVAFGFKRVSPSCRTVVTAVLSLLGISATDIFRLPEPFPKDGLGTQLNEQLKIEEKPEVPKEVSRRSQAYKPLLIKSQFKDPERAQKLVKRQKKTPAVMSVTETNTKKRKAKTVKIGKKHRKSLTTTS